MQRDKRHFWIAMTVGLVLGAMSATVTPGSPTSQTATPSTARLFLFAPASVLGYLFQSHGLYVVLSILQFPAYGWRIGGAYRDRRLGTAMAVYAVFHLGFVVLGFLKMVAIS